MEKKPIFGFRSVSSNEYLPEKLTVWIDDSSKEDSQFLSPRILQKAVTETQRKILPDSSICQLARHGLETQTDIAHKIAYINTSDFSRLNKEWVEIIKMISRYNNQIRQST